MSTAKTFWNVGGFNEDMGQYYSYEDDDMTHRLELSGLQMKKIIPETHRIIHMLTQMVGELNISKGM